MSKEIKLDKHCKSHPNDLQSKNKVKPATAGVAHTKRTALEARVARALAHEANFGPLVKED